MNQIELLKEAIIKYLPFDSINKAKDYVYNYLQMNGVTNIPSKNSSEFKQLIDYLQNELGALVKSKGNPIKNVWSELIKMGYSESDIVITDDILEAIHLASVTVDEDELVDNLSDTYNITVAAPEDVEGDGPGEYVMFDVDGEPNIDDDYIDDELNINPISYYDVIDKLTPEMMKDDILHHVLNNDVLVIGKAGNEPVFDLDAYQSISKYWTNDNSHNVWDQLMDLLDKASQLGNFALMTDYALKDIIDNPLDGFNNDYVLFDKSITYDEYLKIYSSDDFEINSAAVLSGEDDDYEVLPEETWARLLKKGYSEGDTLITDDVIEAITDAAKACCIYDGEYDVDDVTEYLENKYNVEFVSPEDAEEYGL